MRIRSILTSFSSSIDATTASYSSSFAIIALAWTFSAFQRRVTRCEPSIPDSIPTAILTLKFPNRMSLTVTVNLTVTVTVTVTLTLTLTLTVTVTLTLTP